MILSVEMPRANPQMKLGTVHRVHVQAGSAIQPGAKLLDIRVDLSDVVAQQCPPSFVVRLVARERGWVTELKAKVNDRFQVGEVLGWVGTSAEEAPGSAAARPLRVHVVEVSAGIAVDL